METFCNQKEVKPEPKKLEKRKIKSAAVSSRNVPRQSKFMRMPMFDEVQKLSATFKINEKTDLRSVGWDKL